MASVLLRCFQTTSLMVGKGGDARKLGARNASTACRGGIREEGRIGIGDQWMMGHQAAGVGGRTMASTGLGQGCVCYVRLGVCICMRHCGLALWVKCIGHCHVVMTNSVMLVRDDPHQHHAVGQRRYPLSLPAVLHVVTAVTRITNHAGEGRRYPLCCTW